MWKKSRQVSLHIFRKYFKIFGNNLLSLWNSLEFFFPKLTNITFVIIHLTSHLLPKKHQSVIISFVTFILLHFPYPYTFLLQNTIYLKIMRDLFPKPAFPYTQQHLLWVLLIPESCIEGLNRLFASVPHKCNNISHRNPNRQIPYCLKILFPIRRTKNNNT